MSEDVVVRESGDAVLFDTEIKGRQRRVIVTREAIEDYLRLPPEEAADFTQDQGLDFVRGHIAVLIAATIRRLENSSLDADVTVIRRGDI